jgi:hypothetical protein
MSCVPLAEKLAINQQIEFEDDPFIKASEFTLWGMFEHITAALIIEDVNADASDTLDVEIVSRLTPDQDWFPIITFTQVLGDTSDEDILQQTQAVNRDSVFGWGGEVACRATVGAGGTEDFTFSLHIEAN